MKIKNEGRKRFALPLELYPRCFFHLSPMRPVFPISEFWYETQLNWPEIIKRISTFSDDTPETTINSIIENYKKDLLETDKKLYGKTRFYWQDVLDKLLLNYYLSLTLPPPEFWEDSGAKWEEFKSNEQRMCVFRHKVDSHSGKVDSHSAES